MEPYKQKKPVKGYRLKGSYPSSGLFSPLLVSLSKVNMWFVMTRLKFANIFKTKTMSKDILVLIVHLFNEFNWWLHQEAIKGYPFIEKGRIFISFLQKI